MFAISISSLRCVALLFSFLSIFLAGALFLYVGESAAPVFSLFTASAMFQIIDDVVNMLGTDGKTDGGRLDTACQQAFLIQLGVGGGCRMDHQGLHISHICQQGE